MAEWWEKIPMPKRAPKEDRQVCTPRGWHPVFRSRDGYFYTTCRQCNRLWRLAAGGIRYCDDCLAKRLEERRLARNKRRGMKMRAGVVGSAPGLQDPVPQRTDPVASPDTLPDQSARPTYSAGTGNSV